MEWCYEAVMSMKPYHHDINSNGILYSIALKYQYKNNLKIMTLQRGVGIDHCHK